MSAVQDLQTQIAASNLAVARALPLLKTAQGELESGANMFRFGTTGGRDECIRLALDKYAAALDWITAALKAVDDGLENARNYQSRL